MTRAVPSGPGPRRRLATAAEARTAWFFFESRYHFASREQLEELRSLHRDLDSWPSPRRLRDGVMLSEALKAIEFGLWMKALVFLVVERPPYVPPQRRKLADLGPILSDRPPAQTPSEVWGRRGEEEVLHNFKVKFVDDVGAPLAGLELRFVGEGGEDTVTTGINGVAEIRSRRWSTATVGVHSIAQLREVLGDRWSLPREPAPPVGPRVHLRRLDNELGAVTLTPTELHVVVITPYSSCAQVPGSRFAFGSSFVLPSAIAELSRIARNLQGTDLRRALIYGHTDRSGSDLLNKRLSERRAKAIFALLRHDTAVWEELWSGTKDRSPWLESWGTEEGQIMLNALGACDDEGRALTEDGKVGACTRAAIKRFQRGDYPKRPAEQAPLPASGSLDAATRRELFLAYAKLISRQPVGEERFASAGGSAFMGCGEYNPLSLSVRDAESRRVTVLLFGPAAEPRGLPCALGDIAPCQAHCAPAPPETAEELGAGDGAPPYRCPVYQRLARECPLGGGAALTHDLVVRVPHPLSEASQRSEVLLLDSRDGAIQQERSLASNARASEEGGWSEVWFTDLPEARAYRLRCDGPEGLYTVFDYTPYHHLPSVPHPGAGVTVVIPPDEDTDDLAATSEAAEGAAEEATA